MAYVHWSAGDVFLEQLVLLHRASCPDGLVQQLRHLRVVAMVLTCRQPGTQGRHTRQAGRHTWQVGTQAGRHTWQAGRHTWQAGRHTWQAGRHTWQARKQVGTHGRQAGRQAHMASKAKRGGEACKDELEAGNA